MKTVVYFDTHASAVCDRADFLKAHKFCKNFSFGPNQRRISMRKKISRLLFIFFICTLIIGLFLTEIHARTQMNLRTRTQLRPVGWQAQQKLWFAPGTYWIDDWDKGVQSGTLDEVRNLKIWNSKGSTDFGRGFIRFERTGGVKEGVLARDTSLCVVNTASSSKMTLSFKGGKRVEFGYDGCVMKGTLAQSASLRTWDNKTNSYPIGTTVDFNGAGLVSRAVLPPGAVINIDGVYQGNCTIVGIGAFVFKFTARKGNFEGLTEQKKFHLRYKGNYDKNGRISNGILTGWVDNWNAAQKRNVRWTIRGPITGTMNPTRSGGNVSATTSDGKITRTGTWNSVRIAP